MQAARVAPSTDRSMRVLPVREGCILVELADLDQTLALLQAIKASEIVGIREVVPAARSLLIGFDPGETSVEALTAAIVPLGEREAVLASGPLVDIPVRYDGEDLAEVARILNTTAEEIVRRHCGSEYVVAFTGFAPGFAYLAGGDPRLTVPRRSSPRTHVPAGSVGLAGEFSGIYPKASPGGWQLIGTTPLTLFDIDRSPASLLQPGCRVRFRDITQDRAPVIVVSGKATAPKVTATEGAGFGPSMEILSRSLPVTFQDLGRSGQTQQGVGRSGAMDRGSLKAANRLVGNPVGSPALEVVLGGLDFRMSGRAVAAVSGAPAPIIITAADGVETRAPHNAPFALDDGDLVRLGVPTAGMRSYLAVRGGFDVAPVLGSAATDTLAQIGPPALGPGDVIRICPAATGSVVSMSEPPAFAMPRAGETVTLDVFMGPRTDWFTDLAVESFLSQEWLATAQTSRVGIRLQGDPLERKNPGELPSEATVHGAIQVPASGQPVLFLADHPLTGGYPVIANVAKYHLDLAGQVPVGARIRFRVVSPFTSRLIPGKQT